MARVVVGMSGGVDSSLAAALVQEAGHEVVGVTLKLWPCAELDGGFTRSDACCSPSETVDARAVAVGRGLAHYVIDAEDEFRRDVVDGFTAAWLAGSTPNPCIRCNEKVKFGLLWQHARALGAERVATGHYARVAQVDGVWHLRRSLDRDKDQTYFLFSLSQEQLAHAEFPVGHLDKPAVRAAARERRLTTADKHESQDICFIGAGGVEGFLRRAHPEAFRSGPIRHADGRVVGEHRGLWAFTIGQRHGLGIGWREPLYVVGLDAAANALVVGERSHLLAGEARLRDCTWRVPVPATGLRCRLRPRHRARPEPALVLPDGQHAGAALVRWDAPQPRSSPGQACVAYSPDDEWCWGGGWFV